jgi:hypothetical protein
MASFFTSDRNISAIGSECRANTFFGNAFSENFLSKKSSTEFSSNPVLPDGAARLNVNANYTQTKHYYSHDLFEFFPTRLSKNLRYRRRRGFPGGNFGRSRRQRGSR